tara:strand:- start:66 stop:890 length:825 start_codon:yes stop_codon:yes gene_type:complete
MKNYLILYVPGMCGTWLTWLIGKHANFPQYRKKNKNYINDKKETKPLDIGCFGSDYYIYPHMSKDDAWLKDEQRDITANAVWIQEGLIENGYPTNCTSWTFEENRRIRPVGEIAVDNVSFTKDCIKTLPNHGVFAERKEDDNFEKVNKELLKNIVDEVQPEKIIVPIFNSLDETLVKRWIIYLYYHNKHYAIDDLVNWQRSWHEWSDYVIQDNPYGNNVHYVDIEKLTSGDNDEYLKLCEAINETPLDNAQEEITSYRNIMLEVAADFDRNYTT